MNHCPACRKPLPDSHDFGLCSECELLVLEDWNERLRAERERASRWARLEALNTEIMNIKEKSA